MCGIVGYIGNRDAFPILIKGLQRLEYRGYDSAGVAMISDSGNLNVYKKKGKVSDLLDFSRDKDKTGNIGIGHTRWATHGEPNDVNSHPHYSQTKDLVMIHNGIIENYASLKEGLEKRGHTFLSQTDTEVLIHLIEDIRQHEGIRLGYAVMAALKQVIGAYAILILDKNDPDTLFAAKKGSPMVIGVGNNEFFIASDASPIVEYTKNVVYIEDEHVAIIRRGEDLKIRTIRDKEITPYVQELEMELEAIEKGGYDHFMLKEIYEQPRSIFDSMRGRLNSSTGHLKMGGIEEHETKFKNAKRILVVACGTSWHAGMVAEYLFEEYTRIPVEVEYASEFRYRNPIIDEIPDQFQFRGFIIHRLLEAGGRHKIRYTLRPVSRGEFHFHNLLVFVTSQLGFVKRRFTFHQHMMMPCYPSFLKLRQFELMAISDRLVNVGIKKIRRVGHSTEFDHIREYVPGNDIRAINWKASARARNLMVNHFMDERAQQVYSVINTGRIMQMPFEKLSLLDYAINASLVLSHIAYIKHDKPGACHFFKHPATVGAGRQKRKSVVPSARSIVSCKNRFS